MLHNDTTFWEIIDQLDLPPQLKHVYMYAMGSGNDYHSSESYATYADDVLLQSQALPLCHVAPGSYK